jgi:hypothetical protein
MNAMVTKLVLFCASFLSFLRRTLPQAKKNFLLNIQHR